MRGIYVGLESGLDVTIFLLYLCLSTIRVFQLIRIVSSKLFLLHCTFLSPVITLLPKSTENSFADSNHNELKDGRRVR